MLASRRPPCARTALAGGVLVFGLSACGADPPSMRRADAAPPSDASRDQRALGDAPVPGEVRRPDAGTADTGPDASMDAGPSDARTLDASTPDARLDSALDAPAEAEAAPQDAAVPPCVVPTSIAEQPRLLSETGCTNMADPTRPPGALIPYTVISPLWSDGAVKHRFFSLPAGATVDVKDCAANPERCDPAAASYDPADDGHWEWPIGTVLVKTFVVDDRLIETRLLMRFTESTYRGFSYEWNEDESEATLLETGKDRDLGSQVWHYPSRGQCLQCHTEAAGRTLGPTTRQMDTTYPYADGEQNQLTHLESLGVFASPPAALAPFPAPDPSATETLEQRARAYLATNCSICHRPGGVLDDIDLRFDTPFADTDLCSQPIIRGTGDPQLPQIRLTPGDPDTSSLSFRMHDLDGYRMPKIGSGLVDAYGVELIDDWITSITGCP